MKLVISIGNLNKKFVLFLLIMIALNILSIVMDNIQDNNEISLPLKLIIKYGFRIFFIIPEILTKNKCFKKKIETPKNEIAQNRINYIYNRPSKNVKTLIILTPPVLFIFYI